MACAPFDSDAEAVRLANETRYGLGNAVVSKKQDRAFRLARRLRSGVVWVNSNQLLTPVRIIKFKLMSHQATPFGGARASGFGWEGGQPGLQEFQQAKTIIFRGGKKS